MTMETQAPRRLTDLEGSLPEQALGRVLKELKPLKEPSAEVDAAVLSAMKADAQRRKYSVAAALLALLLLAAWWVTDKPKVPTVASPPVLAEPLPPKPELEAPRPATPLPPRPPRVEKPPRPMARPAPETSDTLLSESRLLLEVSKALSQGEAEASRQLLNAYDARFPEGALQVEALTAWWKLHLFEKNFDEAAATLARLKPLWNDASQQAQAELHLAEALATHGHCPKALVVLDEKNQALWVGLFRERALWTKAACVAHADERAALLEAYLGEFPKGRFATQAQKALLGETK